MADEPLVFGTTAEGLWVRGLKGKVTPELMVGLRALGLDLEKPLLPAYNRQVITSAVLLTAKTLYPHLSLSDAHAAVGHHVTSGLNATILGHALLRVVQLVGPHRTMERLARTFRSTNNYMAVTLRKVDARAYELELLPSNDYPSYMAAVVEDMLTVAGAKALEVKVLSHDKEKEHCVYRISWS